MLTAMNSRFFDWFKSFGPVTAATLTLFLALIAGSGCETLDNSGGTSSGGATSGGANSTTSATKSTTDSPTAADAIDRVQVGDMIQVTITEVPNSPPPFQQQVRADGRITLLQGYEFNVAGKKRQELEKEIENFYVREKEIFRRMTVTVVLPPRLFSIGGEVRGQGQIMHPGQMTVVKAIHAAGGFTDYANKRKIVVTRASDKSQVVVDYKKAAKDPRFDVPIFPGDIIIVEKGIF